MRFTFLSLLLLLGSSSFADIKLQDGSYDTNGYCSLHLVTDLTTGNLLTTNISCNTSGMSTWTPTQTNEFQSSKQSGTYQAADIKNCAPTKKSKTPCPSWLYDSKGNFMPQAGDQIIDISTLHVINTDAFEWSWGTKKVMHGNDVVATHTDDPTTVLYVQRVPQCR